ncbi:hypothetical protein [Nonomuraea dietziae]|uniref:hypothetical protein n=1 Tax=Nonomuraea dietziae TaxID=65515 RepID=UPI0034216143
MTLGWNDCVGLVVADVDDTLAPPFHDLGDELADELTALLASGVRMLLASGAGLEGIRERVVSRLPAELRAGVLVAHCNGAEVYGFDERGEQREQVMFSVVDAAHRATLRGAVRIAELLMKEFDLAHAEGRPSRGAALLDDRGVQVTLDLSGPAERDPVLARARELLEESGLDVEARPGGASAVDLVLPHVDKGHAVRALIGCGLAGPGEVEVWGDQFSVRGGGADVAMAMAVPQGSRVISFRAVPPCDVPAVPGMRIWPGPRHLDEGVLDHLRTRRNA